MARKTVRSFKPLMWMAAGSALTLLVVWGPHKTYHQAAGATYSLAASVQGLFG